MIDERSVRRPGFAGGRVVRLSDGREWSLPLRDPVAADPEYDALLAGVREAEDGAETLRAELALTIFLLTRNYRLAGDALADLLAFSPGDPGLGALQDAAHHLAVESARRTGSIVPEPMGARIRPSPTPRKRRLGFRFRK